MLWQPPKFPPESLVVIIESYLGSKQETQCSGKWRKQRRWIPSFGSALSLPQKLDLCVHFGSSYRAVQPSWTTKTSLDLTSTPRCTVFQMYTQVALKSRVRSVYSKTSTFSVRAPPITYCLSSLIQLGRGESKTESSRHGISYTITDFGSTLSTFSTSNDIQCFFRPRLVSSRCCMWFLSFAGRSGRKDACFNMMREI